MHTFAFINACITHPTDNRQSGTPPNLSDKRRRALQWHMIATDAERVATAARLAVFAGESESGVKVEC
jgi:hypothetical protein